MIREDYPYLYETHLHTMQSSACAHNTGKEMAQAAKDAGYTGIIVTDHSWFGNNCIDQSLLWEEWIEQFCKGYEDAKAWGDKIGLDVFFGYESCYRGTEFLIYGVDKQWLKSHPQIKEASIPEQHQMIREAGMTIPTGKNTTFRKYVCSLRMWMAWKVSMLLIPLI